MSPPLVELRSVGFGYEPDRPVLTGVDLAVPAGRRCAVLGPNGGGKTTLFRLMVGALAAGDGTVLVDGAPLRRTRSGLLALRQRVQLVLQDPDDQLFAATVFQDVSFGPVNLGLPEPEVRRRCAEALDALEITDLADRPTHLLSYGQRKRVAIAGAVALRPALLILDEPTAGLDPYGVEALLRTLDGLHARGTTLMLATHDVDLAYRWADELVLVASGRVSPGVPGTALAGGDLLAGARLTPAWAPLVHRLLDRTPGLAGARPRSPDELARLLAGPGDDRPAR
ncbi:cobalt ABC transporter [Micromonospora rosaria]|uniref:ABC transporter ATP-binding protein n=1 Tax=Micromonospora rosaria TaxID=47874 RepID=A0A136PN81_9ACTN|nr:ABC transporter ATP-binding protein [Micromonospora rosaria]KXK59824.1 cobalt ABC transporter [Micromonospora rosaria]